MAKNFLVFDAKPSNNLVLDPKPSNNLVFDAKPGNNLVLDPKPSNILVFDAKPNNLTVGKETEQVYSITISRGQSMGLLLALTYPTAQTFNSSYAP